MSLVRRTFQRKFQRKPLLIGILFGLVIVSIGLGGGLGLGLHNQQASSTSASASTASPSRSPLVNGALKDTSLASLLTADGNRHLFFQDVNGTLRRAQFSVATNSWLPSIDFILTLQQPRNHTPISAIQVPIGMSMNIYYVDVNDTLSVVQYSNSGGNMGTLSGPGVLLNLQNETIPVSSSARSLSVSRIPSNDSNAVPSIPNSTNVQDEYLLFYENPNNSVSVMHGHYFFTESSDGWTWKIAGELFFSEQSGISNGSRPSAPFSTILIDDLYLQGNFYNSEPVNNDSSPVFYTCGMNGSSTLGQHSNQSESKRCMDE